MKKRARIVSGLAALAAFFLAPLTEASLTRATSPALQAPALSLTLAAPEPSEFSLFDGTEIARALASRPAFDLISITTEETPTAARTRFVSSSELSTDELAEGPELVPITSVREQRFNLQIPPGVFGLEPLRGPPGDEASYPKTRYRVFGLLGTPILGELRGVSLELHWRSASFSCELASGTVGWLTTDPAGEVDSVNLYGYVGLRPQMGTDPLGLIELPEGPLTTSYSTAAKEALNPSNPTSERIAFGILGLLVAPAAGVEQAIHGFLATPERLNRNVPGVVRETKAAMAATDTDTRLRHGAAALGAGSSAVLDVSIIGGLAKSAATATIERELAAVRVPSPAQAAPAPAVVNVLKPATGLSAGEAELVARIEPELASITSQAARTIRAGQGTGPAAARYAAKPSAMEMGNAVQEEAFRLIRAGEQAGTLPPGFSLNLGRQIPGGGRFAPQRPDIRFPLGGGRELVWDVTTTGQAGHAASYATPSHAAYVAELLY
jgi:hypothetical protein